MADEVSAEEKYAPVLPKQLRDQIEAVEQMVANAQRPPGEEPPDENDDEENGDEHVAEPAPEEPQPLQPGQEPPPPATPPAAATADDWEQRARSAQGRLEQAVTANQQLAQRVSQLENQLSTIKIKGDNAKPVTPPQPVKLIKEEELADYGDEFFDVV